jgi:hypothetical protein
MSRTSKADRNFFSISNGSYQWYAGTDSPEPADGPPDPLHFLPEDPQSWDAVLKICDETHDVWWGQRELVKIAQGRENAFDLNAKAHSITLAAEFGVGGGRGDNVVTIKGGCSQIRLSGIIYSTGNNADVVTDAWSDQSSDLVSGVLLSGLIRGDGKPVTIILGRFGSKIDGYPISYKVLFWKSLGYRLYWLGKWAAVKLGLMGGRK